MSAADGKTLGDLRAQLAQVVRQAEVRLAEENRARLAAEEQARRSDDWARIVHDEAARAVCREQQSAAALVSARAAWDAEREQLTDQVTRLAERAAHVDRLEKAVQDLMVAERRRPLARLRQRLMMLRTLRERGIVARSPLFNRRWYVEQYPDVVASGFDPADHYLWFGASEDRDPGPGFSGRSYLDANPDVRRAGLNPLAHYERFGRAEGRPLSLRRAPEPAVVASAPDTTDGGRSQESSSPHPELPQATRTDPDSGPAATDAAPSSEPAPEGEPEATPRGDGETPLAGRDRSTESKAPMVVERVWEPRFVGDIEWIEASLGRPAFILNWEGGFDLQRLVPASTVFPAPATDRSSLPYLDQSIDIVVAALDRVDEARRVAVSAVFAADSGAGWLREVWRAAPEAAGLPTASIVIPVFNHSETTHDCVNAVLDTLPSGFRGEILVMDDASTDDTPAVVARLQARDSRVRRVTNEKNLGFLETCNRAAAAAIGEVLVFLNNDTLPRPGWLPPLLRVLAEEPGAGAVGAKLLFPDGRLQEAGGVIFRDASGANIGRGDSRPDRAIYNMLREVHYCSGAVLATPRALFLELGGFDTRFRPAYYEDTDYCFTLRQKGYRVFFQPESEVVHLEGVSSGTDISAGVKQHQATNQIRFREKWREVLARHPEGRFPDAAAIHEWVFTRPCR